MTMPITTTTLNGALSRWTLPLTRRASTSTLNSTTTKSSSSGSFLKSKLQQLWDRYSIGGQQRRIVLAERLFWSAHRLANDPVWYQPGVVDTAFRPRHSMLTTHVWFLHKRLIGSQQQQQEDEENNLLVQEELFDILWHDTKVRIRNAGLHELTVNKNLSEVQKYTFQHCMHLDHAFSFEDEFKRREEIAYAVWTNTLLEDEEASNDVLNRMALYIEWQYHNILYELPKDYFQEGRLAWGHPPDFSNLRDNEGNLILLEDEGKDSNLVETEQEQQSLQLPEGWYTALTESGDEYYWNEITMESSWDPPQLKDDNNNDDKITPTMTS